MNRKALERDLRGHVSGEVRFSAGDRAMYATGGSNYRQVPIGVVLPRSIEDVLATLDICRGHEAPVVSRGGGTSLAGQACNVAVLIDFSKYLHEVLEIDPERKLARVQPGAILDRLRDAAEEHELTFGPDPSTHDHCTLGGMIGNNACGVHSVMSEFYGPGPTTAHNVAELDVVTYRGDRMRVGPTSEEELERITAAGGPKGEIYAKLRDLRDRYADLIRARYPQIPRRVSGYNLDQLLPENGFNVAAALAGTEGTCVTVLDATVHLVHSPRARALLVLGYDDAATAADQVPEILEHRPLGLEGIDDVLVEDMTLLGLHREELSLLPDGRGWLLVEFGGETKEEADEQARALMAELGKARNDRPLGMKLYDDPVEEKHVWEVREAGLGSTAFVPGKEDAYEGWEDSAVPPERVGDYIRDLRKLGAKYGYESALYGHYGQGCIHARWNFDFSTREELGKWRSFLDEAADLVLSHGGSLSGEHGDGQARAELLPKMFGDDLVGAFREFKAIWDPDWKMNPGKVVDADRITDNLRLGPGYNPMPVETHFAYPQDRGSFAHATVRCVGVGKCRRTAIGGGVMCPSYLVTREEKHTTRGRARLLFEMLQGNPIEGGWRNEDVFDALDLCLSCKGCTNDCPVQVDIPTLKAEFRSHYWAGRLRPRSAYAFGLIDQVSRGASRAPQLVNFLTRTPPFDRLAKLAAGMAPERTFPAYAPVTFKRWFRERGGGRADGERVILWPDTFTNFFEPQIGVACVEVLEAAGYQVTVPEVHLCCGRPLYEYGMLGLARRYLLRVVDELREDLRAGVPMVGIEPSCLATFKDELPKMLPHDEDGKRLTAQAYHFADFLREGGFEPPPLRRNALLHGHCHHKATGGLAAEHALLERMGVEVTMPDSGCCGLAGSFGFEEGHYDVAMACGERVLLPAVREADAATIVVADGFSCRTQIEQGDTGRQAVHIGQVVAMAMEHGPDGPAGERPERKYAEPPQVDGYRRDIAVAALGVAGLALAGAALARTRSR